MAIGNSAVWEVRTTGNAANGGGFDSTISGAGTDYSKQDAAQASWTNLSAAQNATTLTDSSATGLFTAAMIGNAIQIASGTNFVAGWYFITAFTDTNNVVLDRAPATAGAGSVGVAKVGGGLTDPAVVCGVAVGGNTIFIKSGTYTISSAGANVAGGRLAPTAGGTAFPGRIIGYTSNRALYNTDARPLLQLSTATGNTILTIPASGNFWVENINFDGGSLGTSKGIDSTAASAGTDILRCKFSNFTSNGQVGGGATLCILCEGTSNSAVAFSGSHYLACTAHDNTNTGFQNLGDGSTYVWCASWNNSGASSDGFLMSAGMVGAYNCVAYNCGRDGFHFTAGAEAITCVNCLSEAHVGFGFRASAAFGNGRLINCGGKADGSGLVDATTMTAPTMGLITATSEIFVSPTTANFAVNLGAGGGQFRGQGLPGYSAALQLPGSNTQCFLDIGVAQHLDAALLSYKTLGPITGSL